MYVILPVCFRIYAYSFLANVLLNCKKGVRSYKIFKIVYYKFETNFLKKSSTDSPKSLIFWPRPILTDEFGVVVVAGVLIVLLCSVALSLKNYNPTLII